MAQDVTFRPMTQADCGAVAVLLHQLAEDTGGREIPKIDAAKLAADALGVGALMDVTVAARMGEVIGACLGLMTYSTWRAARGLYIVDLVVDRPSRGTGLGEALLRASAKRALGDGAAFIKLEVDIANPRAAAFYERLGFKQKDVDRLYFLEPDALAAFAAP
jgi:ribosomal protein S18 acetylase RimI-like enzyme